MTSMPLESLTLAILRKAELGFLGVMVVTLIATPRLNELPLRSVNGVPESKLNPRSKAGVFDL